MAIKKQEIKKILFSALGNMFEWYDYTLYSAFVPMFTRNFFPQSGGEITAFVLAFATFAAGYLARPIGGLLLGYVSDTRGRETALRISVWGMTISSFLIGLLPTIHTVGLWATALLVFLRVAQGISIGGEFGSSAAYLIEIAPKGRQNLYGSFVMFSLAVGILMGTGIFLLMDSIFGQERLFDWAWRIPFLLSILLGFLLIKIRSGDVTNGDTTSGDATGDNTANGGITNGNTANGGESRNGQDQKIGGHLKKIKNIYNDLKANKGNALIAFGVALGDGFPFYVFVVAFGSILHSVLGYHHSTAALVSTVVVANYAIAALLSGILGDKFTSKRVMQFGSLLLCAIPFLVFTAFKIDLLWATYLLAAIAGCSTGIYHGSLPNFLIQSFPAGSRTTIVSLTYSIGMTIFGATAPMICYLFIQKFDRLALLLIPLAVSASALTAFTSICLRRRRY